jgi:hypothetical protein
MGASSVLLHTTCTHEMTQVTLLQTDSSVYWFKPIITSKVYKVILNLAFQLANNSIT